SNDVLALAEHPIFNVQAQLWGDPSGEEHDLVRGEDCLENGKNPDSEPCAPKQRQETPFLTMPVDCSGNPLHFQAFADSWEEPGVLKETSFESTDLQGNAKTIEDCAALEFKPTIQARP